MTHYSKDASCLNYVFAEWLSLNKIHMFPQVLCDYWCIMSAIISAYNSVRATFHVIIYYWFSDFTLLLVTQKSRISLVEQILSLEIQDVPFLLSAKVDGKLLPLGQMVLLLTSKAIRSKIAAIIVFYADVPLLFGSSLL